jgi:hypothetical protein
VVVNNEIGHYEHEAPTKISSEKPYFERSSPLAAQDAVDWRAKELERARPRYHLLWWKHRHQSTKNRGVVNGEDTLQEDYLDNDVKKT